MPMQRAFFSGFAGQAIRASPHFEVYSDYRIA